MKINEAVRKMHPPKYTTTQAAALVGRDPQSLKRWSKKGYFTPSEAAWFGSVLVPLYTDEDIDKMRLLAKGKRIKAPTT